MRTVLQAASVVLAASLLLFLTLRLSGLVAVDAAKVALTPFSAIGLVNSKLEERAKVRTNQPKLAAFSDFSMPFWKIVALASLSTCALLQFMAFVAGVFAAAGSSMLTAVFGTEVVRIALFALVPLNFYVTFAAGRWVGIRSESRPFLAAALVGSLIRLSDIGFSMLFVSREAFKVIYSADKTNAGQVAGVIAVGLVAFGGTCMLGCWRGRRRRQAWYLVHLLKSVAPESRSAIIDLAYEEAQKTLSPATGLRRAAAG